MQTYVVSILPILAVLMAISSTTRGIECHVTSKHTHKRAHKARVTVLTTVATVACVVPVAAQSCQ